MLGYCEVLQNNQVFDELELELELKLTQHNISKTTSAKTTAS